MSDYPGRPHKLTPEAVLAVYGLHLLGVPVARIARVFGVSRPTVYTALFAAAACAKEAAEQGLLRPEDIERMIY